MGDMADLLLEQMWDEDDGGVNGYDNLMYDEDTNSYYGPGRRSKSKPVCRYCGKKNLYWQQYNNRWLLYESDDKVHNCPKHPLPLEILKQLAFDKLKQKMNDNNRFTIEEYGCMLTLIGKSRSEDYFTHVSAVGIDENKRILGIAYNGLKHGEIVPEWMKLEENRVKKSTYYLHAEDNLFSLIKRGECHTLCLNISPCLPCCRIIVANDVKRVIYIKEYHASNEFKEFFKFHKINCVELSRESKNKIKEYLTNLQNFSELS